MNKKNLSYVYMTLLVAAIGMMIFTTISGVAAAEPSIQSGEQSSDMSMKNIGVSLQKGVVSEGGETSFTDVSSIIYSGEDWTTSTSGSLFDDATIKAGQSVDTDFRVYNYGEIGEYVRVIVYRYWVDEQGNKDYSLNAEMIKPIWSDAVSDENSDDAVWVRDIDSKEKTYLYYNTKLNSEDASEVFLKGVKIDGSIKNDYEAKEYVYYNEDGSVKYTRTVYDYAYNGKEFKIEIEVDAIQDHHAQSAIKSAWGKSVTVDDDAGKITNLNG